MMFTGSAQAEDGQDEHHEDEQAYEIDHAVHWVSSDECEFERQR